MNNHISRCSTRREEEATRQLAEIAARFEGMNVKSLVAAAKETSSISADEIEDARDEVRPLGHFPGGLRVYCVKYGCSSSFFVVIFGVSEGVVWSLALRMHRSRRW